MYDSSFSTTKFENVDAAIDYFCDSDDGKSLLSAEERSRPLCQYLIDRVRDDFECYKTDDMNAYDFNIAVLELVRNAYKSQLFGD